MSRKQDESDIESQIRQPADNNPFVKRFTRTDNIGAPATEDIENNARLQRQWKRGLIQGQGPRAVQFARHKNEPMPIRMVAKRFQLKTVGKSYQVLPYNPLRKALILCNQSAEFNTVYISFGQQVGANSGIALTQSNDTYIADSTTVPVNDIWASTSLANLFLDIFEGLPIDLVTGDDY